MKSRQTKITLAVAATVTALMVVSALLGVIAVRNIGIKSSEQILSNLPD